MKTNRPARTHQATVDAATNGGRRILARQTISGTQSNRTIKLDFISARSMVVEPRAHDGGSGIGTMRALRLMEAPAANRIRGN